MSLQYTQTVVDVLLLRLLPSLLLTITKFDGLNAHRANNSWLVSLRLLPVSQGWHGMSKYVLRDAVRFNADDAHFLFSFNLKEKKKQIKTVEKQKKSLKKV